MGFAVVQGHFQVVFSKEHCPLRKTKLSSFMRVRHWQYLFNFSAKSEQ